MVPNRTCHGDQPCDNGSNADLKCILGQRKTQLEASDMSFPSSRRVKLLVKINTYFRVASKLYSSHTSNPVNQPRFRTCPVIVVWPSKSLSGPRPPKRWPTVWVLSGSSHPVTTAQFVMSVGSLRSSDSHDSDWFSQGYTKETQSTSLVPTALLMDLCIGSVAWMQQCGGNQHKGEPCHP